MFCKLFYVFESVFFSSFLKNLICILSNLSLFICWIFICFFDQENNVSQKTNFSQLKKKRAVIRFWYVICQHFFLLVRIIYLQTKKFIEKSSLAVFANKQFFNMHHKCIVTSNNSSWKWLWKFSEEKKREFPFQLIFRDA